MIVINEEFFFEYGLMSTAILNRLQKQEVGNKKINDGKSHT